MHYPRNKSPNGAFASRLCGWFSMATEVLVILELAKKFVILNDLKTPLFCGT
jgi:hypothetical protein